MSDPYARPTGRPDEWAAPQPQDPYADPQVNWGPPSPQPVPYQAAPRPMVVHRRPAQPVVTIAIIAVCIAVWLGERASTAFLNEVALAPAVGLVEPWRLLTSAFAHSPQVMHIAFNMMALWSLGQGLELALGRARFSALYLLSALGGSIGFILACMLTGDWNTWVVGASGAVFGLFGALLPIQRMVGASSRSLYLTIGINAVIGFTIPGIAWQAHVGGFLTGLLAGWLMMRAVKDVRRGQPDRTWTYLSAILVGLVVLYAACYTLF